MERGLQPNSVVSSDLTSWERWVDSFFTWVPYATLAVSAVLSQIATRSRSDRLIDIGLVLVAALWTWLTFNRQGSPTKIPQPALRLYFAGFVAFALLLMTRSTVFLVYAITGLLHASLLRPWPVAFAGIGAAGFVVHSHIVITESTPTTWAIYVGIVAIQTAAVFGGLYAGQRISEIAEERRLMVERLEMTMAENAGLHDQLVTQAREAGVLDERQRMAREIHDTIAQGLTGVIMQIEAINEAWGNEDELRRRLDNATALARDSLTEARRSAQAVRPTPLEDSRLPDALATVATDWSAVSDIPVQVSTTGHLRPLHPEIEVVLLRVAQEGLANVAKHAAASRVGVTLTFHEESVALDVRDDGCGFDPNQPLLGHSLGLAAMRQRVANVGGESHIESAPGEGTAVSVQIPTGQIEPTHG